MKALTDLGLSFNSGQDIDVRPADGSMWSSQTHSLHDLVGGTFVSGEGHAKEIGDKAEAAIFYIYGQHARWSISTDFSDFSGSGKSKHSCVKYGDAGFLNKYLAFFTTKKPV